MPINCTSYTNIRKGNEETNKSKIFMIEIFYSFTIKRMNV